MSAARSRRRRTGRDLAVIAGVAVVGVVAVSTLSSGEGPLADDEVRPELLAAYVEAADRAPEVVPGCQGLDWPVLAGIGRVESHHARGSEIGADGRTDPLIFGPRLDGSGAGGNVTPIRDTDGGRWDQDTEFDRAVGPMQFIPTSWELYGQDATGDGVADPHNIHDATLAAAVHLCGFTPVDLTDRGELRRAVLRYNQSGEYADSVLRWAERYAARYPDGVPTGS